VHVHHTTDEGFYVLSGTFAFLLDRERIDAPAGTHLLVPKGRPHTFWNIGGETSRCLILLSPPGFEAYFRELAAGYAAVESEEEATELRRQLGARYDIEVVGPPVTGERAVG
jgi:oxalate decarboxylase/phosphoglucose isomerase-like protein (cupin superfamily)